ncbi:hypothetical protein B0A49_12940 [Cryomyces minteri]|uniref:Calcium channel YVC1-like C-terminal transmembrane domain-containing protein n=1 Tax=Cryomyces minteri TaxID=331657 RepID=A0A4V5NBE4_9PEZI|nr:hypothetical protein B0A49_12940 [Cryomyces minteri]
MLGLFLAVLIDRSLDITPLEVIFWFWSAGFMLDEIVGFTEQGFGLYIMSVWNAFDLGILLLFVIYYVLRLYGILMPDVRKHHVANMAYDVLASTAVLLFPRLFSVLDHYRYFSQLLIAFRMMAVDLVAILILIIISCSGFFVAFTLSFGDDDFNANGVAYALFQMLMGFTPAAWDIWGGYNMLGKSILTLFLFICHFLIVTILITVLTNSFMAVVQNANEEHQFLFAVNTISMVKSDALFSYIAPTNVLGWLFTPLRYFIPFRQFVRLNRTVIKVTHFPVLFTVFVYERVILSHIAYEPTDLVERRGRSTGRLPGFSQGAAMDLFSPGRRLREPSVTTFHKDRALEEVFRRPFRDATVRLASQNIESDRGKSTTVVDHWMQEMGHEGGASPPMEQPRSVVERLEQRRPSLRRFASVNTPRMGKRDFFGVRSALSDPEDLAFAASSRPQPIQEEPGHFNADDDLLQETDADGDDELVTNDEADRVTITPVSPRKDSDAGDGANDKATRGTDDSDNATDSSRNEVNTKGSPQLASSVPSATRARLFDSAGVGSGTATPAANMSGRRTPKRTVPGTSASRARPVMPPRHLNQSVPNLAGFLALDRGNRRKPSFNAIALDLASDLGDNRHGPDPTTFGGMNGMAASFNTQMAYATGAFGGRRQQHYARESQTRTADDDAGMMSRIMLARMNTLEEGFRDIVKEVKEWRKDSNQGSRPQSEMADVNPSLRQRDSEREWERERERPRKPRKLERRGTRGRGGASLGKESRDAERENRSDRPLTPVTSGLSRVQDSSSPQDSPEAAREDSP